MFEPKRFETTLLKPIAGDEFCDYFETELLGHKVVYAVASLSYSERTRCPEFKVSISPDEGFDYGHQQKMLLIADIKLPDGKDPIIYLKEEALTQFKLSGKGVKSLTQPQLALIATEILLDLRVIAQKMQLCTLGYEVVNQSRNDANPILAGKATSVWPLFWQMVCRFFRIRSKGQPNKTQLGQSSPVPMRPASQVFG